MKKSQKNRFGALFVSYIGKEKQTEIEHFFIHAWKNFHPIRFFLSSAYMWLVGLLRCLFFPITTLLRLQTLTSLQKWHNNGTEWMRKMCKLKCVFCFRIQLGCIRKKSSQTTQQITLNYASKHDTENNKIIILFAISSGKRYWQWPLEITKQQ